MVGGAGEREERDKKKGEEVAECVGQNCPSEIN